MASPRPLRLLCWDNTGVGAARVQPLLTATWGVGGTLYRAFGRFDAALGVGSWAEALEWIATVAPERPLGEVQYWGHGLPGRVKVAGDVLDADVLFGRQGSRVDAVRARLVGGEGLIWFRTCSAFAGSTGQAFAVACTRAFGCRAAGHTYTIGPIQSGLHSVGVGEKPGWSVEEGLPLGETTRSLPSGWGEPNTIGCLRDRIPEGW